MEIEITSVTFKATVDGKEIERTFTPGEQGLPGILNDVFRSIRFYLFYNANRPETKGRTGGAYSLYE